MQCRTLDPRADERGIVLLSALIALVIVSAMAAVMFTTANAEMRSATTHRIDTEVTHLAEAATMAGEQALLASVANLLEPPTEGTVTLGEHEIAYTIERLGEDVVDTDDDGVQTIHQNYLIESTVEHRNFRKTVHRVVDIGLTPIFQYAIFYDPDLELLPGPSMTLSGRVHSNNDIFVGSGNNSTLTIASQYFRCAGSMYRKDKFGTNRKGRVEIQTADGGYETLYSESQLASRGVPSESGFDSSFRGYDGNDDGDLDDASDWPDFTIGALTTWGGTVQTGAHGMRQVEAPEIGSIKRFQEIGEGLGSYAWSERNEDYRYVGEGKGTHDKGRYHNEADLVIVDGQAYDQSGDRIQLPTGTVKEKTFYDAREGRDVTVTEIDIEKLNLSGYFPANGLLYAVRRDASVEQPNGIRLTNGGRLADGLTVVSENPVYIHGDYNTEAKKPAAVISDAVNLLSKAWRDNNKQEGQLPSARKTTYNCAMITGGNATQDGVYSGGFENLPRFHEDWSAKNCIIRGSFVNIYESEVAQGDWSYGGDVYKAPNRNWDYDYDFNDVSNLPPFTPLVAQVRNSGWWQ